MIIRVSSEQLAESSQWNGAAFFSLPPVRFTTPPGIALNSRRSFFSSSRSSWYSVIDVPSGQRMMDSIGRLVFSRLCGFFPVPLMSSPVSPLVAMDLRKPPDRKWRSVIMLITLQSHI